MTDKQILQKVFNKINLIATENDELQFDGFKRNSHEWLYNNGYKLIIFSHNFAKVFWGEEKTNSFLFEYNSWELTDGTLTDSYEKYYLPKWQYHLQQMVLEKEPLKYLEKFL